MANDPKTGKKAATKAPKAAGHKVPKYAQGDQMVAPSSGKPASKGTK